MQKCMQHHATIQTYGYWELWSIQVPGRDPRNLRFQQGLCLTRLGICEKGVEERSNAILPKPWWVSESGGCRLAAACWLQRRNTVVLLRGQKRSVKHGATPPSVVSYHLYGSKKRGTTLIHFAHLKRTNVKLGFINAAVLINSNWPRKRLQI